MADLKNRFDKITSVVTTKEPYKVETGKISNPKWIVSSYEAPRQNLEVVNWEQLRKQKLQDCNLVPALLASSLSIYEESLASLIPGINIQVVFHIKSEIASRVLMKACSMMNLKLQRTIKFEDCYMLKNEVTETGVKVTAYFNDDTRIDITKMLFEEISSSQQVGL